MSKCELVQCCTFPTDFSNNLPAQLASIKRAYCNYDFRGCARYYVYKKVGLDKLTDDLHPGDKQRADLIINGLVE